MSDDNIPKTVIMTVDEYTELSHDRRRIVPTEYETLSKGREVLTKDAWSGVLGIGARVRIKNTASMNGLEGIISFQDGNLFSVSMDNGKEYGFAAWELEAAA